MLAIEKELIESIKEFAFLQYTRMKLSGNFGEADPLRVKIDFLRNIMEFSVDRIISISDLDQFYLLINEKIGKYQALNLTELVKLENDYKFKLAGEAVSKNNLDYINKVLEKAGSNKRIFNGARREGFLLVLFGAVVVRKQNGFTAYILDKEEARTPSAVFSIAAFTTSQKVIVIRRQALELSLYCNKDSYPKDFSLSDLIETTVIHESAHARFSDECLDKDFLALSKLLETLIPKNNLEFVSEMIVDWMPGGVFPSLAELAAKDYARAKRLFYGYLSEYNFATVSDHQHFRALTKMVMGSVKPFIKNNSEVDFGRMLQDAEKIYQSFVLILNNKIASAKVLIEGTKFRSNGLEVSFTQLAKAQNKAFLDQDGKIDPASLFYKRFFWANMLQYLKVGAPAVFDQIKAIGSQPLS